MRGRGRKRPSAAVDVADSKKRSPSCGDDKENIIISDCSLASTASPPASAVPPPKAAVSVALLALPDSVLTLIFTYFVSANDIDIDTFLLLQQSCSRLHAICHSMALWHDTPLVLKEPIQSPLTVITDGSNSNTHKTDTYSSFKMTFNKNAFRLCKVKVERGTEGKCFKAYCRPHQKYYAVKRANPNPTNLIQPNSTEGVPYYFIRELAALKYLKHENINELLMVCLNSNELYSIYPYIELSLYEYMYPVVEQAADGDVAPLSNLHPLPRKHAIALMKQLFSAVAFFHGRGILHRNLKPKHLLIIPGPDQDDILQGATLKVADFSLVRMITCNARELTSEVITLWYRCPEILLGKKAYSSAVDMWSVGCIHAELLQGTPLFCGQSEIEQLFAIFHKLGSPRKEDWPEVTTLPHYREATFPDWPHSSTSRLARLAYFVGNALDVDVDMISKCLLVNPAERITADEACKHSIFSSSSDIHGGSSSDIQGGSSSDIQGGSSSDIQVGSSRDIQGGSSSDIQGGSSSGGAAPFTLYNSARALESGAALSETYLRKLHFLHQLELQSSPSADCSLLLRGAERVQVVDRLICTVVRFQDYMCQRTLFFALGLLDRFMRRTCLKGAPGSELFAEYTQCKKGALAALGTICLHVASKCEDTSYISLKELFGGWSAPTEFEVVMLEERLLTSLDFDLYVPTTIDFLRAMCMILTNSPGTFNWNIGDRLQHAAFFDDYHSFSAMLAFLAECTMHFDVFTEQRPSVVAVSVLRHAMKCFDLQWPSALDQVLLVVLDTSIGDADVVACTAKVASMHSRIFYDMSLRHLIIRTKYSSAQSDKWTPQLVSVAKQKEVC